MIKTLAYRSLAASIAVTVAVALSACSVGGSAPATPKVNSVDIEGVGTIKADPELQALVPKSFQDSGTVRVATNAPFAPYEMFTSDSDQTLIGLEPDLGHAVGALLGLDFAFTQQPFDGLVPGIQANKYDVVMATFFDTVEREAVVDMVNYSATGSGILVVTGNPQGYKTSDDLCGANVAVQPGSAQVEIVDGFSTACTDAGKAAIVTKPYPLYSDELLALSTGQVSAVVGDIPAMSYSLTQDENKNKFELVIEPEFPNGYHSAPIGIAVSKTSGLTKAVAAAVTKLMDNGVYTKVLEKWGVSDIAIDKSIVNAASK